MGLGVGIADVLLQRRQSDWDCLLRADCTRTLVGHGVQVELEEGFGADLSYCLIADYALLNSIEASEHDQKVLEFREFKIVRVHVLSTLTGAHGHIIPTLVRALREHIREFRSQASAVSPVWWRCNMMGYDDYND
jgi:hypothetical protein